ncbi:5'-3' exoribonuclease 1 isoform X2 [Cephus cinctus]|uniref:5'-3' exoribonuclease 1 n=1 Tax=Cephus cinctus TaxID=211228 RepID=A0AAJ7CD47_CEPCN|nr:5'-3' exoribonuclease 1 isoform X2 [Cephus cinctus]
MGVPKFFRYISERYPCLSESLKEYQIPEFDNLYLDMNGIIHVCSHPNDEDVHFRISEEKIIKDIFHYIEILFSIIKPQKLFFMAVDGVAPRAKMNQQRGRRFRSAKEAETAEARAKARGEHLPLEERFDSNCITPGTVFMAKLHEQLKYFVSYKITTDKYWRKCKVILSGHETPGEGEHKIMDYIRYMKSMPDYDSNTRHCLYGLDADLIMLGLCTHEPHFCLLREEVKFGKNAKRATTAEETKFCILHLSIMRDYLEHEFSSLKTKLKFPFDLEKIIDDWVLMGFLVGNDFIPNLPNLHITNGALPVLYNVYIELLPTLDGYINEAGTLNMERFEKFMEKLSSIDVQQFNEHNANLKYFEAKTGRRPNEYERTSYKKPDNSPEENTTPKKASNKDLEALIKSTNDMLLGYSDEDESLEVGEDSDSDTCNIEFVQHKRDYYMNKLEYENVDEAVLRSQAEGYVRAIQWNLHYYYDGCCSWSWYYPHHYAPYISDIKDFKDLKLEFDLGTPFKPFEQLLAVLPAASRKLLPEPYQKLMIDENSTIIDYYPNDFKTDLNGKKQEWEAVVLIPFIDEKRLLSAMESCNKLLTPEEQKRNSHGPMCIYSYVTQSRGEYSAPEYFPTFINHADCTLVYREDITVSKENIVKGLCPGVTLGTHFPGFPTLQFIKHTSILEKAKVKVFEQSARGESIILCIDPVKVPKIQDFANEYLGKSVFVHWPRLTEARIVAVSDNETKIALPNFQARNMGNEADIKRIHIGEYSVQKKHIAETYKMRMGIEIGETQLLVYACPIIGRRYVFGSQGKMTLEKQWSEYPLAYAYQCIVKDIQVFNPSFVQFTNVKDIFTPKSICIMLGHPHYGAMGEVIEPGMDLKTGRVKVAMAIEQEPDLNDCRKSWAESKLRYMVGSVAAQRLGISSHLLSRITGTIYVMQEAMGDQTPKFNIGLNLKFSKRNEEIPGYTKKENGQWLYSIKSVELIRSYMQKCPDLFEKLAQNVMNDIFHETDLFPEGSGTLNEIVAWLKEQPYYSVESRPCGTESLDQELVKNIEKILDSSTESLGSKTLVMQVKPHLLYKPGLNSGSIVPDSTSQHHLCDRIIVVRESFTVPLGNKGIIVGLYKAEKPSDNTYDVIFDKPFVGGLKIYSCSPNRGYRLSSTDFINISHGLRVENVKTGKGNPAPVETTLSWRQNSNAQNQARANQSSAFASFNTYVPPCFKGNQQTAQQTQSSGRVNKKIMEQPYQKNSTTKKKILQPSSSQNTPRTLPNSNAQPSEVDRPSVQKLSSQSATEYQAVWNELQMLQKSNDVSLKPDLIQKPQLHPPAGTNTNLSQDQSAFLKAVLKISDENSRNSSPAQSVTKPSKPAFPPPPKTSDAPPLVQQLFDARAAGNKKTEVSYCSQLLTYFQVRSMGMPRYNYVTNKETHLIFAQIILPDMRVFTGELCPTSELAAETAALKVITELELDKFPKPNMNILAAPPRQWYTNSRPMSVRPPNVRPMVSPYGSPQIPANAQNPFMPGFTWNPKMLQNPGYLPMPPHPQTRPQQRPPHPAPSSPSSSMNWRSESKQEQKKIAPFVPLQAQKLTRIHQKSAPKGSAQVNKDSGSKVQDDKKHKESSAKEPKEEKVSNNERKEAHAQKTPQNQHKSQKSGKERRSRIAANFGTPPSSNGGGPQ